MENQRESFSWPRPGKSHLQHPRPGRPAYLVRHDRIVFSADLVFLRVSDNLVALQPPTNLTGLDLDLFLAKANGLREMLADMEITAVIGTAAQKPRHLWMTRELLDARGFAWSLLRTYLRDGCARCHAGAVEDLDAVLRCTDCSEHTCLFADLEQSGQRLAAELFADGLTPRNIARRPKARAFWTGLGAVLRRINGNFRHIKLPAAVEQTALECFDRQARAA
ncbi:MAG: hypothetical protein PHE83_17450 [Opitutaceae bacterium]|nr:hypothetical protein [Opitutaceae bacterium]